LHILSSRACVTDNVQTAYSALCRLLSSCYTPVIANHALPPQTGCHGSRSCLKPRGKYPRVSGAHCHRRRFNAALPVRWQPRHRRKHRQLPDVCRQSWRPRSGWYGRHLRTASHGTGHQAMQQHGFRWHTNYVPDACCCCACRAREYNFGGEHGHSSQQTTQLAPEKIPRQC